jgi:hypothetical protein
MTKDLVSQVSQALTPERSPGGSSQSLVGQHCLPCPNVRTELMALRDRGSGELEIEVEILQRFLAIKTSSLNSGQ